MMQSKAEDSVRTKMEELGVLCEREIPIQQLKINSSLASFTRTLISIKANAQKSVNFRGTIEKIKAELRKVEDDLVKALAAKTRKEAERIKTMDSISATRARVEELKRIVGDQKARKNEYAEIMAQQYEALSACEENCNKNKRNMREMEAAMSWYNEILGFRIECGHGVKFIFTNIDLKNPSVEYSFSVRHENDLYTLLECNPQLKDIKEAVHELNKTNGLFKFVRTVREKFQEAAAHGAHFLSTWKSHDTNSFKLCIPGDFPDFTTREQVTSTISVSAPASSASSESRRESISSLSNLRPVETN